MSYGPELIVYLKANGVVVSGNSGEVADTTENVKKAQRLVYDKLRELASPDLSKLGATDIREGLWGASSSSSISKSRISLVFQVPRDTDYAHTKPLVLDRTWRVQSSGGRRVTFSHKDGLLLMLNQTQGALTFKEFGPPCPQRRNW